jgi:hypothetical protein
MSVLYTCEICKYETTLTYNFERHKNKKVPCKPSIAKSNEITRKPSLKLTNKFYNELEAKYKITKENLINEGWHYCGGDNKHHQNYFDLYNKSYEYFEQPKKVDKCICQHIIKENCYITNKDNTCILVLGNCCIKHFLPEGKSGRTCQDCGAIHKNRIVNRCNNCRYQKCDNCNKSNHSGYKLCYYCYLCKQT